MIKELKNKLIFISGVVFALALLFISVQIIQAGWTAPTAPFPGGTIYPPIDTSSSTQTKAGVLILGTDVAPGSVLRVQVGQGLAVNAADGGSFYPSQGSVGAVLNSQKGFYVNTAGFVLPRIPRTGVSAPYADEEGMIYYDTTKKGVKLFNGTNWVDIGSGGGDSFWTQTADGIQYGGGNVTIAPFTSGWFATGFQAAVNKDEKAFSFLAKIVNAANAPIPASQRMSCDKSDTALDCPNSYYAKVASDGIVNNGDKKYDVWEKTEYICPAGYFPYNNRCCDGWSDETTPIGCINVQPTTKVMTKEFMFETKTGSVQKGTLSVDNLSTAKVSFTGNAAPQGSGGNVYLSKSFDKWFTVSNELCDNADKNIGRYGACSVLCGAPGKLLNTRVGNKCGDFYCRCQPLVLE